MWNTDRVAHESVKAVKAFIQKKLNKQGRGWTVEIELEEMDNKAKTKKLTVVIINESKAHSLKLCRYILMFRKRWVCVTMRCFNAEYMDISVLGYRTFKEAIGKEINQKVEGGYYPDEKIGFTFDNIRKILGED